MMNYPNIDPAIVRIGPFDLVGFTLGPLELRWYSLMYIIGLTVVYYFLRYGSRKGSLKMNYEQIENLMVYGLVGMILGARLTYVFVYNFPHYLEHPNEILAVWKGGLSFHGALIGITAAIYLFAKKFHLNFFNITDHVCVSVPVGLGFGRIGNFINGELWGRVTDAPWGMVFPDGGDLPRHPSQLYESMLEGWLMLIVMAYLYRKKTYPPGFLSGVFLIGYGSVRFVIEFFREPDSQLGTVLGPFSMGQILCAIMWMAGGLILTWAKQQASDKAH